MKILLLIAWISFFFIFYLFSKIPYIQGWIVQNVFLEAQLYFFASLACVFLVFTYYSHSTTKNNQEEPEDDNILSIRESLPSKYRLSLTMKTFFQKYVYYIGCVFLYISIFLLFQLFLPDNAPTSQVFLCINILLIGIYIFKKDADLLRDTIILNAGIVSVYYIGVDIWYLLGNVYQFHWQDIANILCVCLSYIAFLRLPQARLFTPVVSSYAVIFLYITGITFLTLQFGNAFLWIGILVFIGSCIFLFFTDEVADWFQVSRKIVRTWGIGSSYMFFPCAYYYMFDVWGSMGVLFCLLLWLIVFLQYEFHERFENYVSLFFCTLWTGMILLYLYKNIVWPENMQTYYVYFFWIVSIGILIWDGKIQDTHTYDTYFYHIISLLVNICCIFSFFFFSDVSILTGAIFLLFESLYFFASYYSLNRNTHERHIS